jgi:DivIVA domain-containing protein
MDVSPQELRDTDIREGFRGYHRDDVDELLERAATTIEGLSERVRQLTERMGQAESAGTRNRETEETLQRTLILAQKTADEAIADAQKRARKMLDDAEAKSRTLVSEAEGTARRIAEDERRRLESDVRDLSSRRDKLKSDVDALERFEADYRQRVRAALEAELDSLGQTSIERPSRPTLHEVEVPAPEPERIAPARPEPPPAVPAPPPIMPEVAFPEEKPPADAAQGSAPGGPPVDDVAEGGERGESGESGMAAYVADEPIEAEVLDDDAFFASLREAVRDDEAPLELREDATSETFFDQEEEEDTSRRRFRRRGR